MKKKSYLIYITDKNGVVLVHRKITVADMNEFNEYYYSFTKTEEYQAFVGQIANTYFIPAFADSEADKVPVINNVFLVNCEKRELTKRETQVAVMMEDGKSVKDGALLLCIEPGTLANHIGKINEKCCRGTMKLSIVFLNTDTSMVKN